MQVKTIDGTMHEIDAAEARRIYYEVRKHAVANHAQHSSSENLDFHAADAQDYATKTQEIMRAAQKELREATGDYPEDLEELYEFAAKYELFGDREDTHIICNFLKVFYCLMQKKSHTISE